MVFWRVEVVFCYVIYAWTVYVYMYIYIQFSYQTISNDKKIKYIIFSL